MFRLLGFRVWVSDFRLKALGFGCTTLRRRVYPNLPKPTFLWVLIINPNIDFIGTLQKSRFWRVKVGVRGLGFTVFRQLVVIISSSFCNRAFKLCTVSCRFHELAWCSCSWGCGKP